MCGRYMITSSFEAMARLFEAELDLGANMIGDAERPNVSPTEAIPVVVSRDGGRRIVVMRWGLLPPWYKTPTGGPLLINARAESIADKPAFAKAVRERRCLIPADGFYEWQGEKGAKTPYAIRPPDGGMIAFAGVWESWRGMPTAAIVTCAANTALAPIHERMPVVIAPEDRALWLGEGGHGAARLMAPAPEEALVATPADAATREHLLRPDKVAAVL
jgi:putative SOS response-associated peptidase YedK